MTMRTTPWAARPLDDPRPGPGVRVLPYHRLGHADPEHRWWKPLVELLMFGSFYLLLAVVLGVVWALVLIAVRGEDAVDEMFLDATALDVMDPALFFMIFFSLALMIPALVAARAVMGPRPVGLLLSVTGRLRWSFLVRCLLVAAAVYAAVHGVLLGLDLAVAGSLAAPEPVEGFWWLIVMVLLLVPLQSAAEELVFRGVFLQAVGRWLRRPVFAILLPVPLFTLGHFYDVWGLLSVAIMAVVAGWLTWRTGGLEAAIALHVVHNMTVTFLGALGLADPDAQETSWATAVIPALMYLLYAWLVVRAARKHRVEVTRTVRLPLPGGSPARGPLPPPALRAPALGAPAGWVCPGPPACPGHWAARTPVPQRLP